MLRQRVLSAIVMIPIVVAAAWLGGWWFTIFVAAWAALAAWELFGLLARTDHAPLTYYGLIVVALLVLEGGLIPPSLLRLQALLVLSVLVGLALALFRQTPRPANDWTLTIGGALYLGITMRFVALVRGLPDGLGWIAATALVTWITDSGAYFIGRRFGKHKLWPRVSPKKSWEGLIGGMVVGTLSAIFLVPLLVPGLTWVNGLVLGLVIGVVALFGDLSESLFKRQVGAKDSSNLIPGHGGFLDRIDSFLFVGPCVYLLAQFWGW